MLQNDTREMSHAADHVAGVLLAAGGSTRMGRPKALLPVSSGDTFVSRIVATLSAGGVARGVVVTRSEWAPMVARLAGSRTAVVINPAPERGQFSSLQCGLAALPGTWSLVIITLVDVPLITADTVRSLIRAQHMTRADVVRPERAGRHGHPFLVSRRVVDALLAADPSETARSVLREYAAATVDVPVADDGPFADVDTPEDYERLLRRAAMADRPAGPDEG
jgi:molybdenum cofactor cytidylyltransferase